MAKMIRATPGAAKALTAYLTPKLATAFKYLRVELKPPTPGEFPAISKGFSNLVQGAKSGKWKNMTVQECGVNAMITAEIVFWFFFGEIVGRRHILGYHITADAE